MTAVRKCRNCPTRLGKYSHGALCDACKGTAHIGDAEPPVPQLPPAVWSNQDVREALAKRDHGALLRTVRKLSGLSQVDLAEMITIDQAYLSRIESRKRRLPPAREADVLKSLGVPADLIPDSPQEKKNRTACSDQDPEKDSLEHSTELRALATQAAEDSLAFTELITPSNCDDDTLEYLALDVSRIATDYVHAPLTHVFTDLVALRDRLFRLLRGHQTPHHTQQLFVLTGTTCLLMAHASQNLGDERSAMAQLRTAWACATHADHRALRAWITGTRALLAEWSPQPHHALRHAEAAAALAPAGESRVRIHAIEARAAARLGDSQRALAALDRMRRAREARPAFDEITAFGGLLSFPLAKTEYYTGSTYSLLDQHQHAEQHARNAVQLYASGPKEQRSYGDEALARVDIIVSQVAQDDLEAATQALDHVASLPPALRIRQLGTGLLRIKAMLNEPAALARPAARRLLELTHACTASPTPPLP